MLVFLLVTLIQAAECFKINTPSDANHPESPCVEKIIRQQFTQIKNIVYLKPDSETNYLLRFLHSMEAVSFNARPESDIANPNLGYLIVVRNSEEFGQHLSQFVTGADWNPYGRFLVIIKNLTREELRVPFDFLLHRRVYDVVVMNGTATTELYSYNPFENYACGKYFTRIINYGNCSNGFNDIYPDKVVTGLKNCFFHVSIPHWPPYGVDLSKAHDKKIGTEEYIFKLISKIEQFEYRPYYDFEAETFSIVSRNMTISGPLNRLQQNQTDIMLGGLMLIPSRAKALSYIYGHLDYIDELRLMVKKAVTVPVYQDIYSVFPLQVWVLILFALFLYSVLMMALLKTKDKSWVILMLLDSLLAHGSPLRSRQTVENIMLIWMLFAFLINNFYTTTLMSFTTKPRISFQVSDEQTAIELRLRPCVGFVMGSYIKAEKGHGGILKDVEVGTPGCEKISQTIKTVGRSEHLITIVIYSIYSINRSHFCTEYGSSTVYSFRKPYSKIIYAMYTDKGFPMRERLHKLALRIREVGLSEKSLGDHYYTRALMYHFKSQGFMPRFEVPWRLYGAGVFIATFTLVLEQYYTTRTN